MTLTPDMLRPAGRDAFVASGLILPDLSAAPIVDARRGDPSALLLRRLSATSGVNGHRGVLYDNRDRGHSALPEGAFPGLARLRYAPELRGADFGLAARLRFPAVVLGNSSTALTSGPRARSLMRFAMTEPGYPAQVFALAANNHLYVYPEHKDHDGADLYPANWPYMVTSQGSSGSDRAFLDALAMTLAAFPKETMDAMRADGLVVPTLQMILRRNLAGIDTDDAYLGGNAHPTVFDARRIRPERMIAAAAALTPEIVPPMVRLAVVEEDFGAVAGLAGASERLFTTPWAVARVWRGFEGRKRIVLDAGGTRSRGGTPVSFRWALLRGDAGKVDIAISPDGRRAAITIGWHDAFEVLSPNGPLTTSRVDIGVFAVSGGVAGAPAMLSVSFPTHQTRLYREGSGDAPRLEAVDYDAAGRGAAFDPVLHWTAPWRDEAIRSPEGEIVGWRRFDGDRVREVPAGAGAPRYLTASDSAGRPVLREIAP